MASNLKPYAPKLVILEECLRDFKGHFFEWNRAVRDIHQQRGIRVESYVHAQATEFVIQGLRAVPHFPSTYVEDPRHSRSLLDSLLRHGWYAVKAFVWTLKALRSSIHADCVLVSTTRIHQLAAWWLLSIGPFSNLFDRVVFYFVVGEGRYPNGASEPMFPRSSSVIRFLIRRFHRLVESGRVCFCSDSDQLVSEYKTLSGIRFEELPFPRTQKTRPPIEVGLVRFSALGPPREEKGSDILLAAIEQVLSRPGTDNLRFTIQWPTDFVSSAGMNVSVPLDLEADPRVEVLRKPLGSTAYEQLLGHSHCILAPYRRSIYYSRSSAVLVEAVTAGIPLIVTAGTWLEREAMKYGAALTFRDGDPEDLAGAIILMAERISSFSQRARDQAALACETHSPERFLSVIWGPDRLKSLRVISLNPKRSQQGDRPPLAT